MKSALHMALLFVFVLSLSVNLVGCTGPAESGGSTPAPSTPETPATTPGDTSDSSNTTNN